MSHNKCMPRCCILRLGPQLNLSRPRTPSPLLGCRWMWRFSTFMTCRHESCSSSSQGSQSWPCSAFSPPAIETRMGKATGKKKRRLISGNTPPASPPLIIGVPGLGSTCHDWRLPNQSGGAGGQTQPLASDPGTPQNVQGPPKVSGRTVHGALQLVATLVKRPSQQSANQWI